MTERKPATTTTSKAAHSITARLVTLDNDPAQVYLTAIGAAELISELRGMRKPMTLAAFFQYTNRDRLPVAGYLQGNVALYRPADVQALAASLRKPNKQTRKPKAGDAVKRSESPDPGT